MTTAHLPMFDATMQKTHQWLHELMESTGCASEKEACGILRAVLHAFRDHLTVNEVVDLAAEMPTLIRGIYYEQWKPAHTPVRERSAAAFLDHIGQQIAPHTDIEAELAVFNVVQLLNGHISPGELSDVRAALPRHIRDLWVS